MNSQGDSKLSLFTEWNAEAETDKIALIHFERTEFPQSICVNGINRLVHKILTNQNIQMLQLIECQRNSSERKIWHCNKICANISLFELNGTLLVRLQFNYAHRYSNCKQKKSDNMQSNRLIKSRKQKRNVHPPFCCCCCCELSQRTHRMYYTKN